MMSKILIDEALRLADALEDTDGAHDHEDAAAELRRLHAENQALRQALKQPAPPECKTEAEKTAYAFGWYKALESVREEKEPDPDELTIAYMSGVYEGKKRKPWVGLTDEQFVELCSADMGTAALIRAVEAKLKENQ